MNKDVKKLGIILVILSVLIASIIIAKRVINNKSNDIESESEITISIKVFNKENANIYDKNIETDKEYLADVLKSVEELKVVTEDSQYGEFITSILDIEQGDNFYWSYYIDNDYATEGISSCKVVDGKSYDFKIEKFEQ